jgi:glutamyl-tRNA synthetase
MEHHRNGSERNVIASQGHPRVRVRFAPSPTGYLHIGGARTVLFNWLVARKTGGTFVLRIEDTDRTRHVEDSVQKILDDLRWLGLTWDEGPDVEGEFGPYYQSRRLAIYDEYLRRLLESGNAYYALETQEELAAMRDAAVKASGGFRYPRPDPLPTIEQGEAARAAGRPVVVRFKMPDEAITVVDDILGDVTLATEQLEDFVIQKGDGFPTYHFACVVDDELMKITHVLRGQEHLMNTPKHVAMQRALGFSTPCYGHMPVIFNMSGSKMSKRDKEKAIQKGEPPPEIDVHDFRLAGYLPEAVTNFIALLGWNPGDEREQFSLEELTATFSVDRIGKTNAKFDRDKLLSFNKDWAARVSPDRLLEAFKDYMAHSPAGDDAGTHAASFTYQPTGQPPTDEELRGILAACAGFRTFPDVLKKAGFLFKPDEAIEFDPKAVKKVLQKNDGAGYAMLEYLLGKLQTLDDWSGEALGALLESACKDRDTKLGDVAQPLRVAITGSTISPPIHESLAMLGKKATLSRVGECLSRR